MFCFFVAQAGSGLRAEPVRDESEEPILTGVSRHKCFEPRLNARVFFRKVCLAEVVEKVARPSAFG